MRLCGIISRFQLLSPGIGQVTHALLTRPPLSYYKSTRRSQHNNSVRLACVRHAASVHPEPGSNSQFIIRSGQNHLLTLSVFYFFSHTPGLVVWKLVVLNYSLQILSAFWNFSGLHYCLFVKVLHSELCSDFCNYVFIKNMKNGEGGIWTLAPLLTTCTLSRGVSSTTWVLLQNSWFMMHIPKKKLSINLFMLWHNL